MNSLSKRHSLRPASLPRGAGPSRAVVRGVGPTCFPTLRPPALLQTLQRLHSTQKANATNRQIHLPEPENSRTRPAADRAVGRRACRSSIASTAVHGKPVCAWWSQRQESAHGMPPPRSALHRLAIEGRMPGWRARDCGHRFHRRVLPFRAPIRRICRFPLGPYAGCAYDAPNRTTVSAALRGEIGSSDFRDLAFNH